MRVMNKSFKERATLRRAAGSDSDSVFVNFKLSTTEHHHTYRHTYAQPESGCKSTDAELPHSNASVREMICQLHGVKTGVDAKR